MPTFRALSRTTCRRPGGQDVTVKMEVTPLELANTYATFASGGIRPELQSIEDLIDAQGRTLDRRKLRFERVTGSISISSTPGGFGKWPRIWPPVMSCTKRRQIGSAPTALGILRLRGSSKPIHTTTTSSGV